jgi:serine phosphatase RsbU (regulator of sigma subunit)
MEEPLEGEPRSASLIVVDSNGHRTQVALRPLPFKIGRHVDNHLVLRDSRVSRTHAQLVLENGRYVLEDAGSRHGTYLNGSRVKLRQVLESGDRIDFGFPDSYHLLFAPGAAELGRLMEQLAAPAKAEGQPPAGGNLAKLRAVLEVARSLQTSFSLDDVLCSVVDAALTVTGCERGFLLLRTEDDLEFRVARDRGGCTLAVGDLRVSRRVIHRALQNRRELLSMSFDPAGVEGMRPDHSVADLDLRSVVCVPLVRINTGATSDTSMLSSANQTAGVLYMDSRVGVADLAGGNRELLQSLAIEASTVLENARLLEEERQKHKMEEELEVARRIQQSLLPRTLPTEGWFRACGSSESSRQVGGDYFDVMRLGEDWWSAVVADVSGKGVSAALLASLLQGAFLTLSEDPHSMAHTVRRINAYLNERTEGAKYATLLYCLVGRTGQLRYINAGHCAPLVVSCTGEWRYLETTAMPVGLLAQADFAMEEQSLRPGDALIAYTDGVTEAANARGQFFGRKRLRDTAVAHAGKPCGAVQAAILEAVERFTGGAPQADDITLCVMEYRPQD